MNRRFHLALLHGAALLVRAPERAEWLAEWSAELWYVGRDRRTAFCLGAFRDAFWLRRNSPAPVHLQSPWHCLALLATLACLSFAVAYRLPIPREMLFSPQPPGGVKTVSGISMADFRQLPIAKSRRAFYGPPRFHRGSLNIALASRNLFDLLGVPIAPASDPIVVLDRNPHFAGRRYTIDGRTAQVAAVLSDRVWQLPGRANAFLLVDDGAFAAETQGYAVAQFDSSASQISLHRTDGTVSRFLCVPLAEPRLLIALLMMMLVGALVLPAVTTLSLGQCSGNRTLRWMFLAAKFLLILPIVLFGSLDVLSTIAIGLQPHALIVGTVIGFRWVLIDQRRRCPVCLRVLTNPTSIGAASGTLLEWYGTELICTKGHGLLHVPELRNSYSEQRWLHLDSSWSSLF